MTKVCIFVFFVVVCTFLSAQEKFAKYDDSRFDELFKGVSKYYTKEQLKQLLSRKEVAGEDIETEKNLKYIFDPVSVKKQVQAHEDFIEKLVNETTVRKGFEFFSKYYSVFEAVYENTKVHPADIIAILNWESKLGEITGTQQIIKIFIGQYFFAEKYNDAFVKEGAFEKENAISRADALKRIEKLKKNALGNLIALLIQASQKKFDPAQVKGSWAGAIGFPQFMPASMKFAVDGNKDGKIDLFTMEDAIASVASYLKEHGYHTKGSEYSFKRYNPDKIYAKGVKMYSDLGKKAGIEPGKCPSSASACPLDI